MNVNISPEISVAHVDITRLKQVLLNLLSNANKFTQGGNIDVDVYIESSYRGSFYKIDVKDQGIGMSPEQCQKVFNPYMQAEVSTARKFGGTGLGLTISKKICELMGGNIDVKSEVDVGSCFTISLPYYSTGVYKKGVA